MEDFMEMGSGGLVPLKNGWFLDAVTGNRVSPDGSVYNKEGEIIWDPDLDEEESR